MTTDKETPYWEQDIAECLRVAAEAIGPNSYYLRAAEYIEEMRDRLLKLEGLEREAAALRADRDALAAAVQDAARYANSMPADSEQSTLWCKWLFEHHDAIQQALAAHGGKK